VLTQNPVYRVIQEELPPLKELISDDILSKKCHIKPGHVIISEDKSSIGKD
jgi:hypothetical protein